MLLLSEKEIIIISADGTEQGKVINWTSIKCRMEGCRSYCASVRWEDGKITYPCRSRIKESDETATHYIMTLS
jgi:hypothetical protein